MKLKEFIDLLENPDMIRIIRRETKEVVYVGYLGVMRYHIGEASIRDEDMECTVQKFRAVPEIRSKRLEGKGIDAAYAAGAVPDVQIQ